MPIQVRFNKYLLITLLGLFLTTDVQAQTIFGRISGTVTDASGATVPSAKVKLINKATQLTREAATDPNGFYVVTNLPVGNYRVTVEAQGFKQTTKIGYDLIADGRLTMDYQTRTWSRDRKRRSSGFGGGNRQFDFRRIGARH